MRYTAAVMPKELYDPTGHAEVAARQNQLAD